MSLEHDHLKIMGVFAELADNSTAEYNPLIPEPPAFPVLFMCVKFIYVHMCVRDVENERNQIDSRAGVLVSSYIPNVSMIHITFDIPNRITAAPACFS